MTVFKSSGLVVAIDGMGGDRAPAVVVEGMSLAHTRNPSMRFILFGDRTKLCACLKTYAGLESVVQLVHTSEHIPGTMAPSLAIRSKPGASMRLALQAVKNKEAACVVSAGNTGAYLALSKLVLKTLSGIDRPAIVSTLPTSKGACVFLDLGGNLSCTAKQLAQFALMGRVFATQVLGKKKPSIGLLNVGSEAGKGPESIREAAEILTHLPIHFHGFVEGTDLPRGTTDVVVTDGFSGNIALKTAEGIASFLLNTLKDTLKNSLRGRLGALIAKPLLQELKERMDPRTHNGAFWLGLNGVAVKSHGGTDGLGFSHAIETAALMCQAELPAHIEKELGQYDLHNLMKA